MSDITWFKVDDTLATHPKARKAGLSAMGLWAVSGAFAGQHLTEGFVPDWYVVSWPSGRRLAASLVAAGLWYVDQKGDEHGWSFHQWEQRQPTKEQVEEEREANRLRQQAWRESKRQAKRNAVSNAVSNGVTNAVTNGVSNGTPSLPVLKRSKDPSSADADAAFEAFWSTYPKKVEKQAARRKWDSTVTRVELAVVMAGLDRYVRHIEESGTERRFIKGPEVWLNKGCWADEYDTETASPTGGEEPDYWTPPPPPYAIHDDPEAVAKWYNDRRAEHRSERVSA